MEKNLDITKPRYSEQIFASPLALRYIEVTVHASFNPYSFISLLTRGFHPWFL